MMCVHELIQQQAKATPDAVAVVSGDQTLTYEQLDRRSNQLANLLCERGVGLETPVGVCMTRSADFVVSALAVLKAGGAYVPLDPSYPRNRIAAALADAGAPIVLTQACFVEKVGGGSGQILMPSDVLLQAQPDSPLENTVSADNLAYIIFTSGSTGRPKGVQITHGNLLNLIAWHRRAFDLCPADRATLHASPGFDAAAWELWPYLASGASVHVVDEEVRTAAEALRDWLVAKEITIGFFPTAIAELLIGLRWPDCRVRLLLTGADTLRHHPPAGLPFSLVNNYGPTECTVVATSGVVPTAGEVHDLPPIGAPIDNVSVYIVDEHLRPVANGEMGELVIGGAGVGRGYRNLPEATADKFVADRFSGNPEARLYRTGDLARRLPDGQIAFLGRLDEQVKIRGFRIEPQEISAVLDRHPAVRASFVVAHRESSNADPHLISYVASTANLQASELRAFLSDYLPEYMIPLAFVRVDKLPLTTNGKVDRAALAEPWAENVLLEENLEQPESPVEEKVGEIVATLLGVTRVGRQDNFFNLGGHSLMGAQIIAKIRDAFGVELSLRDLFDQPTVAGIASEIEQLIHAKLAAMSEEEVERLLASSGM